MDNYTAAFEAIEAGDESALLDVLTRVEAQAYSAKVAGGAFTDDLELLREAAGAAAERGFSDYVVDAIYASVDVLGA